MSGIRIITDRGAVDVPVEIEMEGQAAVDAFVAAALATPAVPVADDSPPNPKED